MLTMIKNLLLLVLSLHSCQILIMAFTGVTLKKQHNKEYSEGYKLDEIVEKTHIQCLQRCLENCRCLSFEMCTGERCRMQRSSNSSKLKPSSECHYFEFKQNNNQCNRNSCASMINCCLTSNPCKNGGTCLPPRNKEDRFYCACLNGFEEERCQKCNHSYVGSHCDQKISPNSSATTTTGERCFASL